MSDDIKKEDKEKKKHRLADYQFAPGQSGNPGGRPKTDNKLKQLCKEQTEAAVKTLITIMNSKKAGESDRIRSANSILDRGYGRPAQAITGDDGGPIKWSQLIQAATEYDYPEDDPKKDWNEDGD